MAYPPRPAENEDPWYATRETYDQALEDAIDSKAATSAIPDALTDLDTTVTGSQLNALKSKVDGIEAGAESNTVDSVNEKTGTVVLDAEDVGAAATSHGHAIADVTGLQEAIDDKVDLDGSQTITGRKTFVPSGTAPSFGASIAPALSAWSLSGSATYNAETGRITLGSGAASISADVAVVADTLYHIDIVTTGAYSLFGMTVSLDDVSDVVFPGQKTASLITATTGTTTVIIAASSGSATITAIRVRAVTRALPSITFGDGETRVWNDNFAFGEDAQGNVTTAQGNIAFGQEAQSRLTTGRDNTAIGWQSQQQLTSGWDNVAIGDFTQRDLKSARDNTAVGTYAHFTLTTGDRNTAVGAYAQQTPRNNWSNATITAHRQTSVGYQSGQSSPVQVDDITTVGHWATAGAAKSTALGSGAQADHAGSVALGSDTLTTAADQVMVGDRDIEITDAAKGIVLKSPDGTRYRLTVADGGTLDTTEVV